MEEFQLALWREADRELSAARLDVHLAIVELFATIGRLGELQRSLERQFGPADKRQAEKAGIDRHIVHHHHQAMAHQLRWSRQALEAAENGRHDRATEIVEKIVRNHARREKVKILIESA